MTNGIARFSFRAIMVLIIAVLAAGFSTALAQTATEAPTEATPEVSDEAAAEEAVADLPETGQGSSAQGNSNGVILLLVATCTLILGGGFLIYRSKRA